MIRVGILVFDDVEELDAVGPYEVFGAAHGERPEEFDVVLIAEAADVPVRCVNGLRILADHGIGDAPPLDVLLIPGGVGTRRVAANERLVSWVRQAGADARLVASVCTGSRVTLASGIAHGKRITTHWSAVDEMRADGRAAEVLDDVRFVVDGDVVHSAGVSAGIDMALWIVGHFAGASFARHLQKLIEYYPAPPYAFEMPAPAGVAAR